MNTLVKKAGLGVALVATALTASLPADAQRYRGRHHNDGTGTAIVAGIAGLAIGAAIASNGRDRDRYYRERGYGPNYDDGYYRSHGYYPNDGYYAYRHRPNYNRCWVERRYDRYYGRNVRVRVCN